MRLRCVLLRQFFGFVELWFDLMCLTFWGPPQVLGAGLAAICKYLNDSGMNGYIARPNHGFSTLSVVYQFAGVVDLLHPFPGTLSVFWPSPGHRGMSTPFRGQRT